MTRQETQLHAVGAELAAAELLEGGLNDLDAPETEVYFQSALAAAAAHCRRLEASIDDTQRRGRRPKSKRSSASSTRWRTAPRLWLMLDVHRRPWVRGPIWNDYMSTERNDGRQEPVPVPLGPLGRC